MSGFKRRIYVLDFEDSTWSGLQVRARGATIGQAVELDRLLSLGDALGEEAREAERGRFLELLAELVVDWNLVEDDDTPIRCDAENMRDQEFALLTTITRAWLRATAQVPPPLPKPSNSGGLSPEESEAMAALSESLTS